MLLHVSLRLSAALSTALAAAPAFAGGIGVTGPAAKGFSMSGSVGALPGLTAPSVLPRFDAVTQLNLTTQVTPLFLPANTPQLYLPAPHAGIKAGPAAVTVPREEPLHERADKALKADIPLGAIYDGAPKVAGEEVAAPAPQNSAPASPVKTEEMPEQAPAPSAGAMDADILLRTKRIIKVLQGGWINPSAKTRLKDQIGSLLDKYFAQKRPEPGYNRAAKLLKRASGEIHRRHIQKAIATLKLAQEDIRHKTSYRATVRVRRKRDSRSKAEISRRYYVDGTRLSVLMKRLKKEGPFSYVRINGGKWVPYDLLPLERRLREDWVLDLVLR